MVSYCRMICIVALALVMNPALGQSDMPPYQGTLYVDSNIISPLDRTTYDGITYSGMTVYHGWDARVANWVDIDVRMYHVDWSNGTSCLGMVDTTYVDADSAFKLVEIYGLALGRIPETLRAGVKGFCLMDGDSAISTSVDGIINIQNKEGLHMRRIGVLEETFVHEGTHASFDSLYATSALGHRRKRTMDVSFPIMHRHHLKPRIWRRASCSGSPSNTSRGV